MLGGGYATIHSYRSLARRVADPARSDACRITVVSADDHHNFHEFTGKVVAGPLPLAVTRTPWMQVFPRARFVHGRVLRVDLAQRVVIAEPVSGGAEQRYSYDELIVGTGGREPVGRIPGMAENGFTLRAPGEFPRWLVVQGRAATPVRYRGFRVAMAFGLGRSATEQYWIPIPGLAGWLLRPCLFLGFMPQRRRAVTVVIESAGRTWQCRVPASSVRAAGAKRVSVH